MTHVREPTMRTTVEVMVAGSDGIVPIIGMHTVYPTMFIEGSEEDKLSRNGNDEVYCEVSIGLASLLAALLAIAIVIIIVLSYKLYNERNKKGEHNCAS